MSVNWSNWGKWLIEKVNKWSFSSKLSSLFQLSFEIFYRFSVILLALVTFIWNKSRGHLLEFSPHNRLFKFTSQARRTRESPVEERRKIKLYVFFSPGLPFALAWVSGLPKGLGETRFVQEWGLTTKPSRPSSPEQYWLVLVVLRYCSYCTKTYPV